MSHRHVSGLLLVVALALAAGCATNGPPSGERETNPADPWEPMNRRIHGFNSSLDKYTAKPIAKGYEKVIPEPMRRGVRNFSNNLRGPLHIINNLLQGQAGDGASETGRFLVNSTVGILGLFDVASAMGMEKHNEDFGQTLAVWGVPDGPFVMIPFAGPQTLRDALAWPLDFLVDPLFHYENASVRDKLYAVRLVDLRARYLPLEELLEDSYDEYVTIREAYLQNRRFQIYDGNPPEDEDFYDDFYGELPEDDELE